MKTETWCKQTQGTKDTAPAADVAFGGYNFEHNNQGSKKTKERKNNNLFIFSFWFQLAKQPMSQNILIIV